jgi:hypothetical protein
MYLPTAVYDEFSERIGTQLVQGFPYVPCSVRDSDEALEFEFGTGEDNGPRIKVPYGEMVYPFGLPANIGEVRDEDGVELCYQGLIGTEGPIFLLGAAFIRNAYVVYDVDRLQISLAPAKYDGEGIYDDDMYVQRETYVAPKLEP